MMETNRRHAPFRSGTPWRSLTRALPGLAVHGPLMAISFVILVPLFWIVSTSLKERTDVFTPAPKWLPSPIVLVNFPDAWSLVPFQQYYVNTVLVAFGLLAVQFVTITLAAYVFARMEFRGRDTLFLLFITQLMIAPQSLIVPNYFTISRLGLLDTRTAIALPYVASAFGTFLLRQTFKTIPRELEEAAFMDGCSRLRFLVQIAAPLARPTYLAFALVSLTYHWNEFFWPLIVTNTPRARTLTVGLGIFAQSAEGGAEWTLLMAGTVIVIGPLLILFLVFQRSFINSFMYSGLKG